MASLPRRRRRSRGPASTPSATCCTGPPAGTRTSSPWWPASVRVTYAEFDVAVNRAAHALADRGLAKGDRLALLSHNCWQYAVLAFATAKLGVVLVPVNFMLGADEIAYILRHSGATRDGRRGRARADRGEGPGHRRHRGRGARLDPAVGRRPPADGRTSTRGGATGPTTHPDVARRRRRPAAADVHLGHRVAAQGRDAVQPVADHPVRELRDRRRHERRRRRAALPADVPLRAAGLLLLRRRLPGRDQHHRARPRPGGAAGDDRAGEGHQAVLPADGVDLAAAPPRLRHHRPVQPAQGLLRRLPDAGGGAARAAAAGCRTCSCGTSTARPRCRRWPRSCGRTSSSPRRAAAGRAALNVETMLVDDDGNSGAARARSARSCTAARTRPWATTTTRTRPPRRSAAAGSTPATSAS